jgi:hypothetical protein
MSQQALSLIDPAKGQEGPSMSEMAIVTTASFAFAATQSTIVVICAPKEQPCELPFF